MRYRKYLRWIGFGLNVLVIGIVSPATAAPVGDVTFPGRTGKIVFVGQFPGLDSELFSIDADGKNRRRLTFDGIEKFSPAWSPDGRKIAYAAATSETAIDIFVVTSNGASKRRLTRGAMAYSAEWSADGSRLLLTVGRSERSFDIEVMNAERGPRRPLFRTPMDRRGAIWSPDGARVAFEGNRMIYTASPNGSREQRLITGSLVDWLADGRSIAVARGDLYRVSLRGKVEQLLLPHPPGGFLEATVSPDAKRAAFTAGVQVGNADETHLFVADLRTSISHEISGSNASEMPDWQSLCTIYGTENRDSLRGTRGPDKICGLGGNDMIRAGGGNDVILGGPGDDMIDGGPGNDWIFGGAGNDSLKARDGVYDIVDGGPGQDGADIDSGRVDAMREVERRP